MMAVTVLSGCQSVTPEMSTALPPEVATETPTVHTPNQIGVCPITPPQPYFWSYSGPAAGEFPVWISSTGQEHYSKLGPKVLPPASGMPQFKEGHITKALVFVDKSVQGDLTITGHQLDGDSLVYFPKYDETKRLNESTLQLLEAPADSYTIPDANQTNNLPEPEGKAVQGMGPLYIAPGCYEFDLTIEKYTTRVVVEIVNP